MGFDLFTLNMEKKKKKSKSWSSFSCIVGAAPEIPIRSYNGSLGWVYTMRNFWVRQEAIIIIPSTFPYLTLFFIVFSL